MCGVIRRGRRSRIEGTGDARPVRRAPCSALAAGIRLLHPSHAAMVWRDLLRWPATPGDSRQHLQATMGWLCRAQDRGGGGGVSAGYSLLRGWLPPYPETTGYIIPTFFDYARPTATDELYARAVRMPDRTLCAQRPSAATQAGV